MLARQLKSYRKRRFNTRFEVRKQLRLRNNLEKQFYKNLLTVFNRNAERVSSDISNGLQFNLEVNTQRLGIELQVVIDKNLRKIFESFINYNIETYDSDVKDLEFTTFGTVITFEQLYKNYIKDRDIVFATLSENQSRMILRTIRQLREQNLTLPQLTQEIKQAIRNFSIARAARIARTETHSASSFASHEYNKKIGSQLDQTLYKKWVSVADGRTRSSHANANGQVRSMDEDFEINGALMKYPSDPRGGAKNVINCRCVVVYVDEEDLSLID